MAEHVPPAELSSMLFRVKKALRRGERWGIEITGLSH